VVLVKVKPEQWERYGLKSWIPPVPMRGETTVSGNLEYK
jgi:hypothetical protein